MTEQGPLAWRDPEDLQKQTFLKVVHTPGGGYAEILPTPPERKPKEQDTEPGDSDVSDSKPDDTEEHN